MKKPIKVTVYLVLILLLVAACILFERRQVQSMVPGSDQVRSVNPLEYTEMASWDSFMNKEGNLFDIYSLTPEVLQQKDCPT